MKLIGINFLSMLDKLLHVGKLLCCKQGVVMVLVKNGFLARGFKSKDILFNAYCRFKISVCITLVALSWLSALPSPVWMTVRAVEAVMVEVVEQCSTRCCRLSTGQQGVAPPPTTRLGHPSSWNSPCLQLPWR